MSMLKLKRATLLKVSLEKIKTKKARLLLLTRKNGKVTVEGST